VGTTEVILLGGGQHAKVVIDGLFDQGVRIQAIFDPKLSGLYRGIPQLSEYHPLQFPEALALISIGSNASRQRVAAVCQHRYYTFVHPSAIVSSQASVGIGSMIMHRAVVQVESHIGDHVIVNTGAQIDHECVIDSFVHLAPGSVLCGCVHVGAGTLIGAGAVVKPGIKIGRNAVVGAGAVVTRDVADNSTVIGNPARVMNRPHE
jgi:sugar O-acyltransferase (sialic acid O-acetyltransferase NeuD family)